MPETTLQIFHQRHNGSEGAYHKLLLQFVDDIAQ